VQHSYRLLALAEAALKFQYTRPKMVPAGDALLIKNGR